LRIPTLDEFAEITGDIEFQRMALIVEWAKRQGRRGDDESGN